MKKTLFLAMIMSFVTVFAQKTNNEKENQSVTEAMELISNYYASYTTEYDYEGKYKMLSNTYKTSFSGSVFTLTFNSYDDANKATNHSTKIDFKKVTEMKPYGGETVAIKGKEPINIPVALKIGFKTKEKIETVNIYVEDEEDITVTPIYKAFETIWKFYKK